MMSSLAVSICYNLHRICSGILGVKYGDSPPCVWEYIDQQYEWGARTLAIFSGYLDITGKKVLDGGCGSGGRAMYYAGHGAKEVLGVDMVEDYLGYAREAAEKRGLPNIRFQQASLDAIPVADNEYDVVILSDVFEHIDRKIVGMVFRELKRVLRPGGRLFIEYPLWTGAYGGHLLNYIKLPWSHLMFSEKTIREVLGRCDSSDRLLPERCMSEYYSLNRITLSEFCELAKDAGLEIVLCRESIVKNLSFMRHIPVVGRYLVSRIEAVITSEGTNGR